MNDYFELTHPQKRIWYIENMYEGSSMYNIGGTTRIQGKVLLEVLEKAINCFIQNNDAIRLRIVEQNGQPVQYVETYNYVKLKVNKFDSEQEFEAWEKAQMQLPMQLTEKELFHFELYQVKDQISGYLIKMHHIICDGWTIGLLTEQVREAYETIAKGEEYQIEPPKSYLCYLEEEEKYFRSERFTTNKNFWLEMFQDIDNLAFKGSSDEIEGCRKSYTVPAKTTCQIKDWIANHHVNMNAFFVSAYLVYMYKIADSQDTVLGLPVMNRMNHTWKNVTGMLTSTMPFRYQINPELETPELIEDIGRRVNKCLYNQKYPYNLLVQDLELRKKNINNLFDISINYYNTKPPTRVNGLPVQNHEAYNGAQAYSLQMIIRDWTDEESITLDFDYKLSDYSSNEIDDMYAAIMNIAKQFIDADNKKVNEIEVFPKQYFEQFVEEYNQTRKEYPADKTVIQLFEEQVKAFPDRIALTCGEEKLTYTQLNEKINQLARRLRKLGCEREKIVALYTERSMESVIGIYAILKSGAAYLPIDAQVPVERIRYMLSDSGAEYVLSNLNLEFFDDSSIQVLDLNDPELYAEDSKNLDIKSSPTDLAYVIYTSGSTGLPKGVMIEQKGLVNYICWAGKQYIRSIDDVMPLYSSLSFDLTVTSIFMPLLNGNELRVYKDDPKEFVLFQILRENRVTVIKLTPAHLSLMKDMDLTGSKIHTMIVGGEDLRTSIAERIFMAYNGRVHILNEYGPTETVVGCMIYEYNPEDRKKSVSIGKPADNVQIYLLNEKMDLVPRGVIGEMYISGDGVARGYLNREDLNKEKFLENPFRKGTRMYRTGDLAKFTDSNLDYVGRVDSQVKIHGYRIELGEIEKQLIHMECVEDAVAGVKEKQGQGKVLCAYLVLKQNENIALIKDRLSKVLPEYMVPQYIQVLPEFPLTVNGKVDRSKLLKLELDEVETDEMKEPETEAEEVLLKEVLLATGQEKASMNANFFYLGGDSVKAILMSSKLREQGYELGVKDIIRHPILQEMVFYMKNIKVKQQTKARCDGTVTKTPILKWFDEQGIENRNRYTHACLLDIPNEIEREQAEQMLTELVRVHDSLRLNYSKEKKEYFYREELKECNLHIKEMDLSAYSFEEQESVIDRIKEDLDSSLDIEKKLLLNGCLLKRNNTGKQLLLVIHHLAVDGVSWRIILKDLEYMLEQIERGKAVSLPEENCSYGTWAEKLVEYGQAIVEQETSYWRGQEHIEDRFPSGDKPVNTTVKQGNVQFMLSKESTEKILTECNIPYSTETREILLVSLLQTMKKYIEGDALVLELEHHGREEAVGDLDISRTVGWFTAMYPFAISLNTDDIDEQMKTVKEQFRKIPNNGIGYGVLKYLNNGLKNVPQKHVRFNYLGEMDVKKEQSYIQISKQYGLGEDSQNDLNSLLDMNCVVTDGRLSVEITYDSNRYTQNFVSHFAEQFRESLESLIDYLSEKEEVEFTPSDFGLDDFSQEDLELLFDD